MKLHVTGTRELRRILAGDEGKNLLMVAISSGQQIANLPPVLECAREGDALLWLESADAKRGRWLDGATAVLRARGIDVLDPVATPDDPPVACAALATALRSFSPTKWHPVLVLNGGTKPMSAGLGDTLRSADPARSGAPYPTIYGQSPAAELWVFRDGPAGRLQRRRYSHAGLTLAEILKCSGHVLNSHKASAIRLWPDGPDLAATDYGICEGETGRMHQEHDSWGKWGQSKPSYPAKFDLSMKMHPGETAAWVNQLRESARALNTGGGSPAQIFNAAVNRAVEAGQEAARRSEGLTRPDERLGTLFEIAVARRVQAWLRALPDPYPISEAWLNPHIARADKPADDRAELDIVLVLANGILLSLECKTSIRPQQELNAALLNLQMTASRLARLIVCWPLYTAFADTDWLKKIHDDVETKVQPLFNTLPFTLPSQPRDYVLEARENTTIVRRQLSCPPFESGLDRLLEQYTPAI